MTQLQESSVNSVFDFVRFIYSNLILLYLAFCLWAVMDRINSKKYMWLHWVGIPCALAFSVVTVDMWFSKPIHPPETIHVNNSKQIVCKPEVPQTISKLVGKDCLPYSARLLALSKTTKSMKEQLKDRSYYFTISYSIYESRLFDGVEYLKYYDIKVGQK